MNREALSPEDVAALAPTEKIGLVATEDERGEPRISLLSSIMANGDRALVVGEFCRGESKQNMRRRPRVGFLAMTLDRRLWRGAATWTRLAREGAEYEEFNRKPMFRYNSYFGVNTVHYLDLVRIEGPVALPLAKIVLASLVTSMGSRRSRLHARARCATDPEPLSPYARGIVDPLGSLSFLAHIPPDDHPRIVPIVQARSTGPASLAFDLGPYRAELEAIPDGARVAVFSMNLGMESVLARGTYESPALGRGRLARVAVDWVYDPMPPAHGRVYPPRTLEAVTDFR